MLKSKNEELEQYRALLHKYANIYVRAGLGEKEDMYQEACMVFLDVYDKFDESRGTPFFSYLETSLKNKLYSLKRSQKREPLILSLDRPIPTATNDDTTYTFLDTLLDDREHVDGTITNLILMGYNMTQISDILGVSRPTVYKRLNEERKNN